MQRRVPQEFVDVWDAWLQESLHSTRQQLGERWLDAYLTSPVWRFVLAEGVCTGRGYAGVMVPSVDRVGRYFPLVILAPLAAGSCILETACETGRPWFDAAESLALAALEAGDLELDAFDAEVEALQGPSTGPQLAEASRLMDLLRETPNARDAAAGAGAQWRIPLLGETPQRAVNALASIELERVFRPCALWWTQGSDRVEPGCLVSRGLPAPASFAAMLTGEWRRAGWSSIELPGIRSGADGDATTARGNAADGDATHGETARGDAAHGSAAPDDADEAVGIIAAAHPPVSREAGADTGPRFVMRPEIGLWGVVCARSGISPGTQSVDRAQVLDRIADAAYDLAPRAPLAALAEETRRVLQRVSASAPVARAGAGEVPDALFFLAQGGECALVWMGAMQAVRVRGGCAVPLLTAASGTPLDPLRDPSSGASPDPSGEPEPDSLPGLAPGSLRDLLGGSALPPSAAVAVRYERLRAAERWMLGSAAALSDACVRALAGHLRDEMTDARAALDALLPLVAGDPSEPGAAPAVMLLAAGSAA